MDGTRSSHDDDLGTHVLAVQHGFPVIEEHRDDLLEVLVEFLEGVALAVRSREPRHVPDMETRIRTTFHDGCVAAHRRQPYDWDSTEVKRALAAAGKLFPRARQRLLTLTQDGLPTEPPAGVKMHGACEWLLQSAR